MLLAHLVPGYFAGIVSQSRWNPEWNPVQRHLLWLMAFGSTVIPDTDVIYTLCVHGAFTHQALWTHSLFVYLLVGGVWLALRYVGRWAYIRVIVGFIAAGGMSHIVLDFISHGTPLVYPFSMIGFEFAPQRVVHGGIWAYVTDPIFLLEPVFLSIAILHWIAHRHIPSHRKKQLLLVTLCGVLLCIVIFLMCLPALQKAVLPLLPV